MWGPLWPLLSVGKGAPLRGVFLHSGTIIRLLFGPPEAQGAWLGGGVPFCGAPPASHMGLAQRKPLSFSGVPSNRGKVAAATEKAGCCGCQSQLQRPRGAAETAPERLPKPAAAAAGGGCNGCSMAAKAGCSGCISRGPAAAAAVSAEMASAAAGPWLMQPFTGPWLMQLFQRLMQPLQPGPAAAGAAKSDHPKKPRLLEATPLKNSF